MGELHLDIPSTACVREFKVEANVGKPQVAYRETIRRAVEKYDYTHKKQTGGSGQFAKVQIALAPLDTAEGEMYEFENKVTVAAFPASTSRRWTPASRTPCSTAPWPVTPVGVKATLLDGGYHDVDSSEMAFKIAGSMAFKRGRQA